MTKAEERIFEVLCKNHQTPSARLLSPDDLRREIWRETPKLSETEIRQDLEARKTTGDVVDKDGRLTLGKSWLKRCQDNTEKEKTRKASR